MTSRAFSFLFLVLSALVSGSSAFAPLVPVALEVNVATPATTAAFTTTSNQLQQGVQNFANGESFMETSTMTLSLKERPPPPTKEELAKKKANFNFWFWGGGFVAPFVATVYYFGPKFWTK
jgi:hypothetical protein